MNSSFIHFSFYFATVSKLICAVFNCSLNCFTFLLSSHVFLSSIDQISHCLEADDNKQWNCDKKQIIREHCDNRRMMQRCEKWRDASRKIKSCKRSYIQVAEDVKELCSRIHATYLTWFTVFNDCQTRARVTRFHYHNIQCSAKTKEINKQHLYHEAILICRKRECINDEHQIALYWRKNSQADKEVF